jgi:hypothetical protein
MAGTDEESESVKNKISGISPGKKLKKGNFRQSKSGGGGPV